MLRGLDTAASGLVADERLQQALANNMANAQTPGFKAADGETLSFPDQLIQAINYNGGSTNSGNVIGSLGTGALYQEGVLNFSEGDLTSSGRALDVAIVDKNQPGTMAVVLGPGNTTMTAAGTITAGAGGRLTIGGQQLAIVDASGKPINGAYAVKNPNYTGSALVAADGSPNYDAAGNPSYLLMNTGTTEAGAASLRVGNSSDLGHHSFYAVAYQSVSGQSGIALTRDGSLQTNNQDILVDSSGNAVLPVGANGQPLPNARIQLNSRYTGTDLFAPNGGPVYDSNGQPSYKVVTTAGQPVTGARLGLVDADISTLTPLGQSEYEVGGSLATNTVLGQLKAGTGSLKPGSVENSTVDTTATMTQMIQVVNQYEANQRVLQTEASLLNSTVTDVGKVNGL